MEKNEAQKQFLLSYFNDDGTMELVDLTLKRKFLRRCQLKDIKLGDLFIGNKLDIYKRSMIIVDYADTATRKYVLPKSERAFLMVRPEAVEHLPVIVQRLEKCFRIIRMKMCQLPQRIAINFCKRYQGDDDYAAKVESLEEKTVVAFLLMCENAIEKLRNLVGEEDPKEAMLRSHTSLRCVYGKDVHRNGFYMSDNIDCVLVDASLFFSDYPSCNIPSIMSAIDNECSKSTLCVIKPHAVKEGFSGFILADIAASKFTIANIGMFWLTKPQSEEFYGVYEKLFANGDFLNMVDELASGPCIAVEFTSPSEGTVSCFRQIVGPPDPDLARRTPSRSKTLRARFGLNWTKNAIHCTDLPESAQSEIDYFFRILDSRTRGAGVFSVQPYTGSFGADYPGSVSKYCEEFTEMLT